MASLHNYAIASHSIGALRRPSAGAQAPSVIFNHPLRRINLHAHLNLGFKKEVGVTIKNRLRPVFASDRNPSEGLVETKPSDAPSGPPFLTILAGLAVFLAICWIVGSIVMWLIGLIVHPPSLK